MRESEKGKIASKEREKHLRSDEDVIKTSVTANPKEKLHGPFASEIIIFSCIGLTLFSPISGHGLSN